MADTCRRNEASLPSLLPLGSDNPICGASLSAAKEIRSISPSSGFQTFQFLVASGINRICEGISWLRDDPVDSVLLAEPLVLSGMEDRLCLPLRPDAVRKISGKIPPTVEARRFR